MRAVYRGAVVGLGNIGFRFSLDPKRQGTWSHVDAYLRSGRTSLAGVVEVDRAGAEGFSAVHPDIPVYPTVGDLFREQEIDIISVAVPTALHYQVVSEIARYPVQAIFCEKPLSDSPGRSREMVRLAGEKGILLALNYTRRWEEVYLAASRMIGEGKIGSLRCVNAFYSGHLLTMGSHLLDTVNLLARPEPISLSAVAVGNGPDPSVSGWISCRDGLFLSFSATGRREDLVFEIDLIGTEGRLTVSRNGAELGFFPFRESERFSGYREPVREELAVPAGGDRFLEAVRDIAAVLDGDRAAPRCTGEDGLWVDELIGALLSSARKGGAPVPFDGSPP